VRVLQVSDLPLGPTGGVEIYVQRVVDGLRAAGVDVDVFAGEIAHAGLGKLLDFWDPRARRLLARRIRDFRPDVVHFHNITVELSVSVIGAAADVPTVMSVHDSNLVRSIHRPDQRLRTAVDDYVKKPLDRAVVRRGVDRFLPVSHALAELLAERGFTNIEVLSPIAEQPAVTPRPVRDCHDVVFVGRLTPDKGAVELVEAFLPLLTEHPDTRLVIVGDGPERQRVRAAAAAGGDRVRFLGEVSQRDVSEAFGHARVVALPYVPSYRLQGSSLAVVEAAMHGRPVVSTDAAAIVELARTLPAIDIVPVGDGDRLRAALDRYLRDDGFATQCGAELAHAAAANFSVEVVVERLRAIYAELVERRSPERTT
jgi:glycosyltransferase involved in cell wall biosynthesis